MIGDKAYRFLFSRSIQIVTITIHIVIIITNFVSAQSKNIAFATEPVNTVFHTVTIMSF